MSDTGALWPQAEAAVAILLGCQRSLQRHLARCGGHRTSGLLQHKSRVGGRTARAVALTMVTVGRKPPALPEFYL